MQLPHAPIAAGTAAGPASIEACDDFEPPARAPRYCPAALLGDFALLMSGHGRCVCTSMMLGDREYAMWQLACARAMGDEELAALAAQLFPYFDDRPAT